MQFNRWETGNPFTEILLTDAVIITVRQGKGNRCDMNESRACCNEPPPASKYGGE